MTFRNDGCETYWNCDHLVPGEDDVVDWDLQDVMLFGTDEEKREFLKERAEAEYKRTHPEKMNLTTWEDWDTRTTYLYLVVPDYSVLEDGEWHDWDEGPYLAEHIIDSDDDEEVIEERLRMCCHLLHAAGVDFTVRGEEFDFEKHCFKQEDDE